MARPRFLFQAKDDLLLPLGPDFSTSHALTGTVNGINAIFNLPSTPQFAPMITIGGLVQRPGAGNDFTISGLTVTFAVAPTQTPVAYY
jgi:hypothetical protein